MVDTAIVGHIADASFIGGIAVGTMLFDLLYWNFGFLRVGTSGMTAQAYGRSDRKACILLLHQSMRIALISGLFLLAIQWLFFQGVMACIPCSDGVRAFAHDYFFIRIWAAPFTLSLMAFKGWSIGMQDTISPMITDIVVNGVNMAASFILAVYTPLGAVGVAYGTLIAQFIGFLTALIILAVKYPFVMVRLQITLSEMRELIRLNKNLFIRSLCFMVVYVGFTALATQYGDSELAVSAILMKLFMLFSYIVDGFAYAGEALVGKAIGEQSLDKYLVRLLLLWAVGVGILFTGVYLGLGINSIRMMTNASNVLLSAKPHLIWLYLMPIVSTLAFMWDGIFIGATAGPQIRNSMIWAAIAFVLVYFLLAHSFGMTALYMAYFAHLLARVVYLSIQSPVIYENHQSPLESN